MGFWQWTGKFTIAGVSCGAVIFPLRWWKEARDRKAIKYSCHAKCLLEEADKICRIARVASIVAMDNSSLEAHRSQASILWKTNSMSSILNIWLANAWILKKRRITRPFRHRFCNAVEKLRQAAIAWHEADMRWRSAKGIIEGECSFGGDQADDDSPEAMTRSQTSRALQWAVEKFLDEFQALHNALQPMVREDISRPKNQQEYR